MKENDIKKLAEFNINDPMVDHFIKESISQMFAKYYNNETKDLEEPELGVVEVCIHYYPNDRTKQESLAYCVIKATMETDSVNFRKVSEENILPLAIELGVEDAIIQEIINLKVRRILGDGSN
jgi:hypothetical protein